MIWSDSTFHSHWRCYLSTHPSIEFPIVLFCLPAKNNALSTYYDMSVTVAPELTDDIPSDIELVFWNYYQTSSEPYVNKLRQHWELAGRAPWMASGVWTWSRYEKPVSLLLVVCDLAPNYIYAGFGPHYPSLSPPSKLR